MDKNKKYFNKMKKKYQSNNESQATAEDRTGLYTPADVGTLK